jgi:hypothetical protein
MDDGRQKLTLPLARRAKNVQHYVIEFVSDLKQVWFSPETQVPCTNKTDLHDITEIFLKVVLNTINPNPYTLYISQS